MKAKGIVLTGVGFIVGVAEALLFYNLGKANGKGYKFQIPPGKELFKTAGMVMITSIITTALFTGLEIAMAEKEDQKLISENSPRK
jgi:hypothetical protein